MLFIGPPFGNYLNLPYCESVKGSFTLEPRPGLMKQIMNTLRYSYEYGGWINKIGLRNKGIDWALKKYDTNSILSIAILNPDDIKILEKKIPKNQNLEINVSCTNAEKEMVYENIECFLNDKRKWCILKLSPNTSNQSITNFYNKGFRQFHCCNTIPIPEGGLSGPKLIPHTSEKLNYIRSNYKDSIVITGGGVRKWKDAEDYLNQGANHISISSLLFNPLYASVFYANYIRNSLF